MVSGVRAAVARIGNGRCGLAVGLVVLMTLSMVGMGVVGGAPGAGGPGSGQGAATVGTGEPVAGDSTATSAVVEPGVESALDGEERTDLVLRIGADGVAVASDLTAEQALKQRAELSQAPVTDQISTFEGVDVERSLWVVNALVVSVDPGDVSVDDLTGIEGVDRIHPNYEYSIPGTQGDSATGGNLSAAGTGTDDVSPMQDAFTYGLEQINAPAVYDNLDTRGEGASVAVIDTGVDPEHPDIDIAPDNFAEFDATGEEIEDPEIRDETGHGTHVSGTVVGGNASGTQIGVAPDAELKHVLGLPGGTGTFAQIAASIEWTVENNADVASLSLGSPTPVANAALLDAIEGASDAGTLVVASSGNAGPGTSGSPASEYTTFAVGATDEDQQVAGFSSGQAVLTPAVFGDLAPEDYPFQYLVPDHSAPGVAVLSAGPLGTEVQDDPTYSLASGTSMAAPHVSGAMALILSANDREFTRDEMYNLLTATSFKPAEASAGQDARFGHGIVDAFEAATTADEQRTITGSVLNNDTGEPLAGAVLTVEETGEITTTDSNGSFTLPTFATEGALTLEADDFGFGPVDSTIEFSDDTASVDSTGWEGVTAESAVGPDNSSLTGEDILGDVTQDGTVGLNDAILIQEEIAGVRDPDTPFFEPLGDLNRDGDISLTDAVLVQEKVAGVLEGSEVEVSNLDAPATVDSGAEIDVSADLENVGDEGALEDVEFRIAPAGEPLDENATVAEQFVDMAAPGVADPVDRPAETTVSFADLLVDLPAGEYEHGVFTADDNETATLTVEEDPEQEIELDPQVEVDLFEDQPQVFEAGETFDIVAGVGSVESVTVDLTDGSTVDPENFELTASLALGDGEDIPVELGEPVAFDEPVQDALTLTVDTDEAIDTEAAFELEHTFSGPGDDVGVTTPATDFEVVELEVSDEVLYGAPVTVEATIENTGAVRTEAAGVPTFIDDEGDSITLSPFPPDLIVSLGPGESATVSVDAVGYDEFFRPGVYDTLSDATAFTVVPDIGPVPTDPTYDTAAAEVDAVSNAGITGTVTDTDSGEPIEGVTVEAESENGQVVTATTDADGQYLMEDRFFDVGSHVVQIVDGPVDQSDIATEAIVNVEVGETATQNFSADAADATIIGQVVNPRGDPESDIAPDEFPIPFVEVEDADGDRFEVETDTDGIFEIEGLDPFEQYALRFTADDPAIVDFFGELETKLRITPDLVPGEPSTGFRGEPDPDHPNGLLVELEPLPANDIETHQTRGNVVTPDITNKATRDHVVLFDGDTTDPDEVIGSVRVDEIENFATVRPYQDRAAVPLDDELDTPGEVTVQLFKDDPDNRGEPLFDEPRTDPDTAVIELVEADVELTDVTAVEPVNEVAVDSATYRIADENGEFEDAEMTLELRDAISRQLADIQAQTTFSGAEENVHVELDEPVVENQDLLRAEFIVDDEPYQIASEEFGFERVRAQAELEVQPSSLTLNEQALGENATGGDAVLVENVTAGAGGIVAVTYTEDGDEVLAGFTVLEGTATDEAVVVDIEDTGGVGGGHTAHVLATVSEDTTVGEPISDATFDAVLSQDSGLVYDAEVSINDQSFDNATDEVTVAASDLQPADETDYVIVIHEDAEGLPVLGSSGALTGGQENVTVDLDEGIDETTDLVAMVHFPDNESEFGPPVVALDGGTLAPVTDNATVTVSPTTARTLEIRGGL